MSEKPPTQHIKITPVTATICATIRPTNMQPDVHVMKTGPGEIVVAAFQTSKDTNEQP